MEFDFTILNNALEKHQILFTKTMEKQLTVFYEMLIEKNKVMNLTGITEFQDVLEKHFLDSISLGFFMELNQKLSIIDLGTGAGFPGIPLKIVFPRLQVVLADSLKKRILFLDEVIGELGFTDISTVHGRAEDLTRDLQYRENFDLCVSRAVSNLSSLSEYCLPFVKVGGKFVSYKSADVDNEVLEARNALHLLGGEIKEIQKFCLPGTELQRSLLFIEKMKSTSKKYPRKAGTPTKQPL